MLTHVIGLGNIGPKYEGSRHNLGLDVVNLVSRKLNGIPMRERQLYEGTIAGLELPDGEIHELTLIRPTTFMNLSGMAVRSILEDFEVKLSEILVVVDDFNLPLGALRIRHGGSDGGHNGLASIIELLETEEFPRLRLGIGPLPDKEEIVDFVLGRFKADEAEKVERMVAKAAEAVIFAVLHRLDEAMSQFNSNPALPEES